MTKSNKQHTLTFVFLVLIIGVITGSIISQIVGSILPEGVVKQFFITSRSIGWGIQSDNWVDLFVLRFKSGLFFDISVVSILGMAIAWYFLRYFK